MLNPIPDTSWHNNGGYDADTGLDILVPMGTPCVAAADGVAEYCERGSSAILSEIAGAAALSVAAVYMALPAVLGHRTQVVQTLQTVSAVCDKVVAALEQTQGTLTGAAKKSLALELVTTILSSLGVKAPAPFIDAAVEAAVLGLSHLTAPAAAPSAPAAAPPSTSF